MALRGGTLLEIGSWRWPLIKDGLLEVGPR